MKSIFLARQPIYDRQQEVIAYELLYRNKVSNRADIADHNKATAEVFVSALVDIGLENIVGNQLAFINLTRSYLLDPLPLPLMQKQIVLEVLEGDELPDERLIARLKDLVDLGYQIAIDDFIYTPGYDALLEVAHIVKLNIRSLDFSRLATHMDLLRKYYNVKVLAKKVETQEEYAQCQALEFDYFQGFFFCEPQIVVGKRTEGDKSAVLRILSELQSPTITVDALENLIAYDATLVYHLLRYMNSAFYNLRTKVESIKHALVLLGTDEVRKWASLMLMLRLSDAKPKELILTGMMRAKMAELIVSTDPAIKAEQYFTMGLLSILDALLDKPLTEVLQNIPLNEEINAALLSYSGPMGQTLRCIKLYEQANWGELMDIIDHTIYMQAYLQAIEWAANINRMLK